jgi:hypothetical protein
MYTFHAAPNPAKLISTTALQNSRSAWDTLRPIQPHSSHLSQAFVSRGSTGRCGQFSRIQVTYHKPFSLVEALFAAANSAAFKSLITSLCVSHGNTVRCGQFSRIQVTYPKPLSLVEALFAAANSAAFKSLIASLCLSLKQCSRHRFSSLLRTRGTTPSISHMISPIVVVLVD